MASSSPRDSASSKEPADIATALGADLENGLSTQEASARLAKNGPNELQSAAPTPAWRRVLAQFQDPLIYLLLAAIAVALVAWAVEGWVGWPVDAIVIAIVVVLNGALGYLEEAKARDGARDSTVSILAALHHHYFACNNTLRCMFCQSSSERYSSGIERSTFEENSFFWRWSLG